MIFHYSINQYAFIYIHCDNCQYISSNKINSSEESRSLSLFSRVTQGGALIYQYNSVNTRNLCTKYTKNPVRIPSKNSNINYTNREQYYRIRIMVHT